MQTRPKISIVVAITRKDAAIGNGGKLLFRISDDLKRFKAITKGHPVIMGRKTFESIGRPLPDRTNFVITRNPGYHADGVIIVRSLEEAIAKAEETERLNLKSGERFNLKDRGEIFVIGGGEIYKQELPFADKLYLTLVESDAEGDVFFPDWRKEFTKEVFREERFDEKTGLKYTWIDLERESVHQVAATVIFDGEKVLLVRHSTHSKHIENAYGLPGGKVDSGETPRQAARRELEEETSLIASEDDLVKLPTVWRARVTFKNGESQAFAMHPFLCKRYQGEVRGTDTEIPEWVPVKDVPDLLLLPHVKEAVQEGLAMA